MNHQPDYETVDRNRYFTGKFLTERDFTQEQEYFLARHSLHNRLLHDWGVVCGLDVKVLDDDADPCYGHVVRVAPGMALDCTGRPIILSDRGHCVDLLTLPPEGEECPAHRGREKAGKGAEGKGKSKAATADEAGYPAGGAPFLLCVLHREKPCEKAPVLFDDDCSCTVREEYNRVHEYPQFCWRECKPKDAAHVECWPEIWGIPELRPDNPAGCPKPAAYNFAPGLPPDCRCGRGVPLALVFPQLDGQGKWTGFRLSPLPTPHKLTRPWAPEQLTHVVDTNWSEFVEERNEISVEDFETLDALEIYFDRPLAQQPAHKEGGVNRFTFQVQYTDPCNPARIRHLQPREVGPCPRMPGNLPNMGARFQLHSEAIRDLLSEGRADGNTRWIDFFITLKCDLILDVNGRAVDGNHLGGTLPTGDGVPGGTFETWFRVNLCEPEPDEESYAKQEPAGTVSPDVTAAEAS